MKIDWGESLKLTAVVLTVVSGYAAIMWAILRPHFQRATLSSLKEQSGEFKKWFDALYAKEMLAQAETAKIAMETHLAVTQQAQSLETHRQEVRESLNSLAGMPTALHHVAEAVDRLTRTVEALDQKYQKQEVALAVLSAQTPNRRRADKAGA